MHPTSRLQICAIVLSLGCQSFQSNAATPPDDPAERALLERAVAIRPSPSQLAWQHREITAFAHFGMNTFTDAECGSGKESPDQFSPTDLDCRQWARVCQGFGARTLVLVAKHVDGFCLWPSQVTSHSVKASPWRAGGGDVVRELATACRETGLGLGIYLSPTDLNHPAYGRDHDTYNRFFKDQLRELLTGYGPIQEVWFDGAVLPGPRQKYDFPGYYALIRQLQPDALIAIKGPDLRWCGNETGIAREDEWSVIPLPTAPESFDWPDLTPLDLGSRARLRGAPFLHWYPAVADVSLRPGWFYHPTQDGRAKSLPQLADIYLTSVGRNAGLLLNLTPDRTGRIPETDVRRLQAWTEWRTNSFATNLLRGANIHAEPAAPGREGHGLNRILDGSIETWWQPEDWTNPITLTFSLSADVEFDLVQVQEAIAAGQRIESFSVAIPGNDGWETVSRGRAVGHMRLLKLPKPVRTREVRLHLEQFRVAPTLANVGLYRSAPTGTPTQ